MKHAAARQSMARLFAGELGAVRQPELMAHVRSCGSCARLYRRFAQLEEHLCQPHGVPSTFALERMEAAILQRTHPAARERSSSPLLVFGLPATVAATILIAVLIWPAAPRPDQVALSSRSILSPVAASVLTPRGIDDESRSKVGVRLFRVRPTPGGGVAEQASDQESLTLDNVIAFTYTNTSSGSNHLALFGLQPDGEVRWYYPGYDEETSMLIQTDVVDEPLPFGVDLSVNHTTGPLQVVALFSSFPLAKTPIEAALHELGTAQLPIVDLTAALSPDAALVEHSLTVQIGTAEE